MNYKKNKKLCLCIALLVKIYVKSILLHLIENKCKFYFFYLDVLRCDYVSSNVFITHPQ